MPAPKRLHPSSLNEWYGKKIRKLRIARGLTQEQLGERVRLSRSRIAQYELGTDVPPLDIVRLLDEALDADGDLVELWDYLDRSRDAKWAERLVDAESKSRKIQHYMHSIPALLQTSDYADVMLRAGVPFFGGDADEKVERRMARQAVLEGPNPPWVWSVLDESALYRSFGCADALRGQLLHLLELTRRPRINVQIIPHDQDTLLTGLGTATIFDLRDGRTVIWQEGPATGEFITDLDSVSPTVDLYDHLKAAALQPKASNALIRKVLEEKYP